jgi:hypothetical protein
LLLLHVHAQSTCRHGNCTWDRGRKCSLRTDQAGLQLATEVCSAGVAATDLPVVTLRKGLLPSLLSILPGSQACRGRSSSDQGQSTRGRLPAPAHMRARASIDRRRTTLCSTDNYRSFASSVLLSWVSCFVLGIRICTPGLACIRWGFSCCCCQLSSSCNQALLVETPLSGFNAGFSGFFDVSLLS